MVISIRAAAITFLFGLCLLDFIMGITNPIFIVFACVTIGLHLCMFCDSLKMQNEPAAPAYSYGYNMMQER